MEPTPLPLDALPNGTWDMVLGALYNHQDLATQQSIAALARTSRGLRDLVRCLRTSASYFLTADEPASGSQSAEHLNKHTTCSTVSVMLEQGALVEPVMAPLLAFVCHTDSSAGRRITDLNVCCEDADIALMSNAVPLTMARAFPNLRSLAVDACISGPCEFFGCLVACCPQLRSLKLHLQDYRPGTVANLSALCGLTSLELRETAFDGELSSEDEPTALLQQLAPLTALTHLSLAFGDWREHHNAYCVSARQLAPALTRLPLRSLELIGLDDADLDAMPALAGAVPSLEQLGIAPRRVLQVDELAKLPALAASGGQRACWHMPCLTTIKAAAGESCSLSAPVVLDVAARCPALQRLADIIVYLDVTGATGTQKALAAALVRVWVQDLGALAARGVLHRVKLAVGSAVQADRVCTALEQLHPVTHRTALAGCIHELAAEGLECGSTLFQHVRTVAFARLAACLTSLQLVRCDAAGLLALVPLRSLSSLHVTHRGPSPGREAALAALRGFARHREVALGSAAAARAVSVFMRLDAERCTWNATVQGAAVLFS